MFTFESQHLHGNRLILPIEKSKGRKRSRVVYVPNHALVDRTDDTPRSTRTARCSAMWMASRGPGTLSAAGSADSDRSSACLDWSRPRFAIPSHITG